MSNTHDVVWCDRGLILSSYHFALCLTEETYHAELDRLEVPANIRSDWVSRNSHATAHFFYNKDKEIAIVCVKQIPRVHPTIMVGLLIHEAVHIWQHICESIGEHHPSKEFEAYSIQHISQELIKAYSLAKVQLKHKRKKSLNNPLN